MAVFWLRTGNLYQAQLSIIALTQRYGVALSSVHGRGGTVGRGGRPTHDAILSQPPGNVNGGNQVHRTGRMAYYKYSNPKPPTTNRHGAATGLLKAERHCAGALRSILSAGLSRLDARHRGHGREGLPRADRHAGLQSIISTRARRSPKSACSTSAAGRRTARRQTARWGRSVRFRGVRLGAVAPYAAACTVSAAH